MVIISQYFVLTVTNYQEDIENSIYSVSEAHHGIHKKLKVVRVSLLKI